jgi:hypothetical protein
MPDQYFAAHEAFSLTAATAASPLSVYSTGGSRRMSLNEFGVSFNGTSSTAVPVLVRLARAAGTPGGSSPTQTPTPLDPAAPSSTFSATEAGTIGNLTTILRTWYVPPTSGLVVQFPLGQEPDGPATTNSGLAIYCNAPATVSVTAYMIWTE